MDIVISATGGHGHSGADMQRTRGRDTVASKNRKPSGVRNSICTTCQRYRELHHLVQVSEVLVSSHEKLRNIPFESRRARKEQQETSGQFVPVLIGKSEQFGSHSQVTPSLVVTPDFPLVLHPSAAFLMFRVHRLTRACPSARSYATAASPHALVFLEHRQGVIDSGSLSALTAAQQLGGEVTGLLVGSSDDVKSAVDKAKKCVHWYPGLCRMLINDAGSRG